MSASTASRGASASLRALHNLAFGNTHSPSHLLARRHASGRRGGHELWHAGIGLLFVLPILSSFSYGIYAGVLSIFGLVFALRKAWELTALVTDYDLTGPFRVGDGPIRATIGV